LIESGNPSATPSAARPADAAPRPLISRRFKDAFKLALSYVIATGIALAMDWEKPYWAALAIFMCSFTTSGDSLHKGLLRIAGTAAAVVVTLAMVAVAPQERWLFLGLITAWILLCGYMLTGGTKGYFWQYAGFTVPILALSGGVQAASSFETVILRAQETGLGVLVYSLVSFLIWPASGSTPLKTAIGTIVDAERRMADFFLGLMAGQKDDHRGDELRARAAPILSRLPKMLDSAALDRAAIRERRDPWRRLSADLAALREALERWYSSLADVRELDLQSLLPGLTEFGAEVDRRLLAIQEMLQGQAPGMAPAPADAGLDPARLDGLPLFDRAALIACTDQMSRVDRLTASLFTNMAAAADFTETPAPGGAATAGSPPPVFDPDRFLNAMRAFIAVWLCCLLAMFVPGLPGPVIFITVTNSVCLALTMMPQVPVTLAMAPVLRALIFTGALYMLVLPRLAGYTELGIVLFLAVLGIGYRFPLEKAPIDRPIWLAGLIMCTGISNDQSYSFLNWANLMLPLVLLIGLVALTGYFPISYQHRDRYLRLLRRFFRSCSFLVGDSQWRRGPESSRLARLRERFHAHEVDSIPTKMLSYCGGVQARIGSDAQPSAQALVATLQGLRRRINEVHSARAEIKPYSERLPDALREELNGWRVVLHDGFERLFADPEALKGADLARRLESKVRHLEASVERLLNKKGASGLTDSDALRLYRLLAALRDMSNSLFRFERQAGAFAWDRLRGSRF
jgi:hypothetical protein